MRMSPHVEQALGHAHDFMLFENAFPEDKLKEIEDFFDNAEVPVVEEGTEGGGIKESSIRSCDLKFISFDGYDAHNVRIFQEILTISESINDYYFRFDCAGIDAIQYTKYGKEGDHYGWHYDKHTEPDPRYPNSFYHRKLSFVLMFSDPEEHEGGRLQFWINGDIIEPEQQKRGTLVVFPSYQPHRVTAIESGQRKTAVWWVQGNPFK